MNREGHEEVSFFHGIEVEHTPAHNMPTLFVVGLQDMDAVSHYLQGRQHIYFGANHSFPKLQPNDADGWKAWEDMIEVFLEHGYLCTLDIDVSCVEGLLESSLLEKRNFIPMISVKLPYIQQLGYNATIKLDDNDFDATNPGVWCHSVHALMDRSKFTSWNQYTKDQTV